MPLLTRPRLTPLDLASIFAGYPTAFLECRGWGHQWKRQRRAGRTLYDQGTSVRGVRFLELNLPCESCGTIRHDRWVLRNGRWDTPDDPQSLGAIYTYPDGFLLAADLIEGGAPTRPEVRAFIINLEHDLL